MRRIGDLVSVQVKYGQHRAVANWIEKLVGVPGSRQRPGFRLTIADHHTHDQVRIVERRSECMRDAVAELAALVDRSRNLRRAVAAKLSGKGEGAEQIQHPCFILALLRIDLGIRALEIAIRDHRRCAVTRAGDVDHVEVVLADDAIEMNPGKGLTGIGSPMAKQPVLEVLGL